MYKMLILSIVALLSVGCSSSKDESGGSSISLNDIKANLAGKYLFITGGKSSTSGRSTKKNNSNTKSLITVDNERVIEYGILTDINLNIQHAIISPDNKYSYVILQRAWNGSDNDNFIVHNNCSMLKVSLSDNSVECLFKSILAQDQESFTEVAGRYQKIFQYDSMGNIGFVSYNGYNDGENNCDDSCLFRIDVNSGKIQRISPEKKQIEQFKMMDNGEMIFTDWNPVDSAASGMKIWKGGGIYQTTQGGINFESGENGSIIYSGENNNGAWNSDKISIVRISNGIIKKTYFDNPTGPLDSDAIIFSDYGDIFSHFPHQGLVRILPTENPTIVTTYYDFNKCGYELDCHFKFIASSGIIFYTERMHDTSKKPFKIHAIRDDKSQSKTILEPNSDCSQNCYSFKTWVLKSGMIHLIMTDINTSKDVLIQIDAKNFDFNANTSYQLIEGLGNSFAGLSAANIDSINTIETNQTAPTVDIQHQAGDHISAQVKFSNKMNYSDVESKISVVDSNNASVGFMPLWNGKTLHLIFDTDNGTQDDYTSNPLPTGTYTITVPGNVQDSSGQSLSQSVSKTFSL